MLMSKKKTLKKNPQKSNQNCAFLLYSLLLFSIDITNTNIQLLNYIRTNAYN